jgi:hypothetical protein
VRHDPPRIVWSGRVWTSETEVPMPTLPMTPIDPRVIVWALACVEHALRRGETNLDLARLVKIGEGGLRMAASVTPPEVELFDDEEDG